MNICVVGTGYVGLVTGTCFAEFGNTVTCVDKDHGKIDVLNQGRMPIYEPGLEALVQRNVQAERLAFSTSIGPAIRDALVVIIAVGTPQGDDGRADLSFVHEVAKSIGENLDSYKVVVTKSTVPAGTGHTVRQIIERHRTGNHPFSIASNPEFLREGAAIEDFMRPNRVVLGTEDETAAAILRDLYRPLYLIETPIVTTDVVTAELIKYASNAFLATKISFINEMADLCESLGADVHVVARAMGLDRRIGPKFLHPGPGFGGSCFPKDTRAIVTLAKDRSVDLRIVRAVIEVNSARVGRMLQKISTALGGSVRGRTICLLGLTFKPNTDDLRESPAMAVLEGLLEQGASLRVFDPAAMEALASRPGKGVVCGRDEYDAAEGADALVLATEWNQFRSLDLERLKRLMREPIVVDLRNVYEPETMHAKGFRYTGVGR
jgi:UDPglucose 6-dehydrogenase